LHNIPGDFYRASDVPPVQVLRAKGGNTMNWDTIKGQWKQFSGKVKEKWGKLTDDDLTTINGRQEQLVGKLQERYGYTKEQAQHQLNEFLSTSKP
jgi:uncharacterized protein YjbJ (UPF0337 family)